MNYVGMLWTVIIRCGIDRCDWISLRDVKIGFGACNLVEVW